jgi:hypothetical protein
MNLGIKTLIWVFGSISISFLLCLIGKFIYFGQHRNGLKKEKPVKILHNIKSPPK